MLPRTNSQRLCGRLVLARLLALALIINWLSPVLLISSTTAAASPAAPIVLQATPTPTPTPPPAFDYTRLVMTTNDLVYDAQSKNILASVPGNADVNANSITPINPETAAIGTPVFIGGNPNQMALSGNNLYVGLDYAGAVGRFDLTTLTHEQQFSLGSNSSGLLRARDLAALPGLPDSIAVVRANNNPNTSIAIYDDGTQRPNTITSNSGPSSTHIESGASIDRLYALDSNERILKTMSVTNQGVSVISQTDVPRGEFPLDFRVAEGRAYFTNGDVMELSTGNILGRFQGIFNTQSDIYRLVLPDPAKGLVYFLYSGFSASPTTVKIEAFDINTFQSRGSILIPTLPGPPSSLIRWGENGLAFRTPQLYGFLEPAQVFLIRTSLIPSNEVMTARIKMDTVTFNYEEWMGASFRIARLGDISSEATVQYATSDGTATAGSDYTAASGTITFAPGETHKLVTVLFNNDALPEADETFNFTLSNPMGATLATPGTFQAAIIDDEKPSFQVTASVTAVEPASGLKEVAVTFQLSGPSAKVITMDYFTQEGTAQGDTDYAETRGTLTFNPGETSKSVLLQIKADDFNETPEFFTLALRNLNNVVKPFFSFNGVLIFILDEPTIALSANNYSINEGANGTVLGHPALLVRVERSGDTSAPATVQYQTMDQSGGNECNLVTGQASQRCDYATQAGTLRFAAGESIKTILIPIVNDGYQEGNETFTIKLQNPAGAVIGSVSQATITINDDAADSTPTTGANNPYLNNEFFVRQNYLDFLYREPDAEGWNTWRSVLNNCGPEKGFLGAPKTCDRAFVSHGFIASDEFTVRGYRIYRMYEVGLMRLPRYGEFVPDMAALRGSPNSEELEQNTQQFAESFTSRQEFIDKYQDVSQPSQAALFIARLEQNAGVTLPDTTTTLPGQPQQYNRQELINKRASGQFTLGQTLRAFVEQKIVYDRFFERGFVTMQYFGFLRRDPDLNDPNMQGWTEWVYVFTNGGADRGRPDILPRDYHHLTFGFIYSEEYRKRFGQP